MVGVVMVCNSNLDTARPQAHCADSEDRMGKTHNEFRAETDILRAKRRGDMPAPTSEGERVCPRVPSVAMWTAVRYRGELAWLWVKP